MQSPATGQEASLAFDTVRQPTLSQHGRWNHHLCLSWGCHLCQVWRILLLKCCHCFLGPTLLKEGGCRKPWLEHLKGAWVSAEQAQISIQALNSQRGAGDSLIYSLFLAFFIILYSMWVNREDMESTSDYEEKGNPSADRGRAWRF